jgi:hypothetical protein
MHAPLLEVLQTVKAKLEGFFDKGAESLLIWVNIEPKSIEAFNFGHLELDVLRILRLSILVVMVTLFGAISILEIRPRCNCFNFKMSHWVKIFFSRVSHWRQHKRLQKVSVHILWRNLFFFIKTICKEQRNLHVGRIIVNLLHRLPAPTFLLVWFFFGFRKSLFSCRTFKIVADLCMYLNLQLVHAIMNTV